MGTILPDERQAERGAAKIQNHAGDNDPGGYEEEAVSWLDDIERGGHRPYDPVTITGATFSRLICEARKMAKIRDATTVQGGRLDWWFGRRVMEILGEKDE